MLNILLEHIDLTLPATIQPLFRIAPRNAPFTLIISAVHTPSEFNASGLWLRTAGGSVLVKYFCIFEEEFCSKFVPCNREDMHLQ